MQAAAAQHDDDNEGMEVYIWGQPSQHEETTCLEPVHVQGLQGQGIRQVACALGEAGHGPAVAYVLTRNGKVRQWGSSPGWSRNLCLEEENEANSWIPLPPVQAIAAGMNHYAAITTSGQLWTWGSGASGELGHGHKKPMAEPLRVREPSLSLPVQSVACGADFTLALTQAGTVFSWGSHAKGVTGQGLDRGEQLVPRPVRFAHDDDDCCIVQISTLYEHAAAVSRSGHLYTWGCGAHGRLGHNNNNGHADCHVPTRVEALRHQEVQQASCGYFHTAVVTKQGEVYSFGSNHFGQLGLGRKLASGAKNWGDKPRRVASPVGSASWTRVSCGAFHSAAIDDRGRLFTWGRATHGQLGHGAATATHDASEESFVAAPQLVQCALQDMSVQHVQCLEHHTLALVKQSHFEARCQDSVPWSTLFALAVNDPKYADVTFRVIADGDNDNDRTELVYAHRLILASRCAYFDTMFQSGMRESSSSWSASSSSESAASSNPPHLPPPIVLRNVRKATFLLLLEYLYTGRLPLSFGLHHVLELYALADLYRVHRLCRIIGTQLVQQHLQIANAAEMLRAAVQSGPSHAPLVEICVHFVVQNFDKFPGDQKIPLKQAAGPALYQEILTQVRLLNS